MQERSSRSAGKHMDETACGPLCQHPLCWASNRRVERGLPRVVEKSSNKNSEISETDGLPTLKICDLFAGESGFATWQHYRGSSAPSTNMLRETHPITASVTPTGSPAINTSTSLSKKQPQSKPPTLKKIEVHEIVEWPEDWSDNFVGSHFYLWCTRKRSAKANSQLDTKFIQSTGSLSSIHPEHVKIKDMTEDLLPKKVQKHRKQEKKKHKPPTGGRPYTNASKTNLHRSYLKSPREDEISQLLNLPKEVLLQVIEHAQNSDIYNKERLHKLLEKVLPQVHFQQHIRDQEKLLAKKRNATGTPLEDRGILLNRKVELKEGPKLTSGDQSIPTHTKPFVLDENVKKGDEITLEKDQEVRVKEVVEEDPAAEKVIELKELTAKSPNKTLAPLKGVKPEATRSMTKLTSVATRQLSPLHPGISPTKPFTYRAKPLDWTLGPLPIKEKKVVLKPVTPVHSDKASTLHVTIPSVMSSDRLSMTTPVTPRNKSPYDQSKTRSPYRRSTSLLSSPAAEGNPIHAISPSFSARVPLAPLGTPAYSTKQSFNTDSALSKHSTIVKFENDMPGSLPQTPVNTPFHAEQQEPAQNLRTIQEGCSDTTSLADSVNIPTSIHDHQWDESTSILVQPSEKMNSPPVLVATPALTGMTTPDNWPSVDEHEYLNSPAEKLVEDQNIAPAAPPPSPEPENTGHEPGNLDELQDAVRSVVTTSLAPLHEEEEEEVVNAEGAGNAGNVVNAEEKDEDLVNAKFVGNAEDVVIAEDVKKKDEGVVNTKDVGNDEDVIKGKDEDLVNAKFVGNAEDVVIAEDVKKKDEGVVNTKDVGNDEDVIKGKDEDVVNAKGVDNDEIVVNAKSIVIAEDVVKEKDVVNRKDLVNVQNEDDVNVKDEKDILHNEVTAETIDVTENDASSKEKKAEVKD
ncbi:uncharacterized protein [Antedon mediterranea]|uniref:uncharacterized protein isoform X2 n=1 Tax=Antedon mediterranea TaxID=105859 RepID=UPI003AF4F77D